MKDSPLIDSICLKNPPGRSKESAKIKLPKSHFVLPWPTYTEPRADKSILGTKP